MSTKIPTRVHTKARRYGPRIQKKWNKRYGFALINREGSETSRASCAAPQTSNTAHPLGRRGRSLTSAARHEVSYEEQQRQYKNSLIDLCDKMIKQCKAFERMSCQFNVADAYEAEFIGNYMRQHAPELNVTIVRGDE